MHVLVAFFITQLILKSLSQWLRRGFKSQREPVLRDRVSCSVQKPVLLPLNLGGRRFQRYVDVRSIRFPLCFFSASLSFCVGFLLVARGDVRGVRTLEPPYNGLCSATKLVIPIVNGRTPPLFCRTGVRPSRSAILVLSGMAKSRQPDGLYNQ